MGLNVAANYLKHHPYRFEEPSSTLSLSTPALYIIVNEKIKRNKINFDYSELIKFFGNQVIYHKNSSISWSVTCDFLVAGFNEFFKQLITSKNHLAAITE